MPSPTRSAVYSSSNTPCYDTAARVIMRDTTPAESRSVSSSSDTPNQVILARQPAARRGHSKSRLGCFSCKRRRVKCDERRPGCARCARLGLSCQYPPLACQALPDAPRAPLTSLALDDLRFHHQFLTVAYPSLPLRGDHIWSQCAAMTHGVRPLSR